MKRFEFRLAGIERLLAGLERQHEMRLAVLHAERAAWIRKAEAIDQASHLLNEERERAIAQHITGVELGFWEMRRNALHAAASGIAKALHEVEGRIAEQREKYFQAHREHDKLQTLHTAAQERYRTEQRREEQANVAYCRCDARSLKSESLLAPAHRSAILAQNRR